jgi:trigger factor
MQGQAERDVRGAILLEKVAELENVEISDEEVNEELERMAQYYRTTMEEIRHSLSQQQDGEANIANSLRTRKAVQALVDHAKITDGEWIDENQPTAEAEDKDAEEQKKEKKPKAENKKAEAKEPKKKAAKKE